jgi:hypothetical protein
MSHVLSLKICAAMEYSFIRGLLVRWNCIDPENLNHPCPVGAVDAVVDKPRGEFAPLIGTMAIDQQTRFLMLVLGLHQVCSYFLDNSGKIFPVNIIVCL